MRSSNADERTSTRPTGPRRTHRRRAAKYRRRRAAAALLLTLAVAGAVLAILGVTGNDDHGPPAPVPGQASRHDRSAATAKGPHPGAVPARQSPSRVPVGARRGRSSASVGTYRVGMTRLTFAEPAPAAIATGQSRTGQPVRLLPTVIRYPEAAGTPTDSASSAAGATAGRFPLVIFSQGYDISAEAYAALLKAWAEAGYVVADPTYPLTDPSTPGGVDEADITNHPADLRFVISSVIAAGRDSRSPLHDLVDPRQVAIIGHSDGGDVSLAVAADSCCKDAAVKAAVILSGAELSAFGGSYYTPGSVPLLVVQGSADTVNIPGCSAQLYDQAPAPKYYLDIPGAEHQPPYLDPGVTRTDVARAVTAFLDAYLRHRPARLQAISRAGRLPGGETITSLPVLPNAGAYCPGAR
jgi:predicted dienelactone hydrolase